MNSKYFRTVSILLVIFGALGVLSSVATMSSDMTDVWALIFSIINSLMFVVTGVMGAKAVKTGDDDKASLCKKLSYALLALAVISVVLNFVVSSRTAAVPGVNPGLLTGMTVISSVFSLILPVLYFLGARKLGE